MKKKETHKIVILLSGGVGRNLGAKSAKKTAELHCTRVRFFSGEGVDGPGTDREGTGKPTFFTSYGRHGTDRRVANGDEGMREKKVSSQKCDVCQRSRKNKTAENGELACRSK